MFKEQPNRDNLEDSSTEILPDEEMTTIPPLPLISLLDKRLAGRRVHYNGKYPNNDRAEIKSRLSLNRGPKQPGPNPKYRKIKDDLDLSPYEQQNVTGTNALLDMYNLKFEGDRTNLILAYGLGPIRTVLNACQITGIKPTESELVVLTDLLALTTVTSEEIVSIINQAEHLLSITRDYYNENPISDKKSNSLDGIEQRMNDAYRYIVKKYILGLEIKPPEPLRIKL